MNTFTIILVLSVIIMLISRTVKHENCSAGETRLSTILLLVGLLGFIFGLTGILK